MMRRPFDLRHYLRVIFVLVWILGLVGVFVTPLVRLALFNTGTDDPTATVLLALQPSNRWYHPYFYSPLREAFLTAIATLRPGASVTLVMREGEDARITRQLLTRNVQLWAYPRGVRRLCVASLDTFDQCRLPPWGRIVTWGVAQLPGYQCIAFPMEFRVCRLSPSS
jgi:hypothetical protein